MGIFLRQTMLASIGLIVGLLGFVTPASCREGKKQMAIKVTGAAFVQGQPIPKKYTGEGADVSPPLAWSNIPAATKELVLICDDPDAPVAEPWVHWVLYKIPADAKGLPEGVARTEKPREPTGAMQGKNSWPEGQNIGYRGPMPPPGHGVHHYHFRLYALDAPLDVEPGLTKKAILGKIRDHVLAEGELVGTYERKK
ncbi:MAG: YbhB/YbcL family Raf kinase inhibitor-like protein [Planctomycetaceae bacterium]|nr:YbhB/YbcL family Raf kinase inhibitor-like protein [Planctomycetaceae bacterium]